MVSLTWMFSLLSVHGQVELLVRQEIFLSIFFNGFLAKWSAKNQKNSKFLLWFYYRGSMGKGQFAFLEFLLEPRETGSKCSKSRLCP